MVAGGRLIFILAFAGVLLAVVAITFVLDFVPQAKNKKVQPMTQQDWQGQPDHVIIGIATYESNLSTQSNPNRQNNEE